MLNIQAFLYLVGVLLLTLAAFGLGKPKVSLALLGAAALTLGFTLPAIAHLFAG